jgi:DNA-binding response OmpR family regulator
MHFPIVDCADVLLCTGDAADRASFECLAQSGGWRFHHAPDLAAAASLLGRRAFRAIVCDADLDGGAWRDLLTLSAGGPAQPRVIVLSNAGDNRLWAEVLNLGGYDLLAKPLDCGEAERVLTLATAQP